MQGDWMVHPDVGVSPALGDTRCQLKQEIGVPATLPHGPQLVSNDTAYARNPTLAFSMLSSRFLPCNRPNGDQTHTVR